MAVVIRLTRGGTKKKPYFNVVALEKSSRRDGMCLERLGTYDPKEKEPKNKMKFDLEGIQAWVAKGALVSQTVGQLLKIASQSKV